MTGWLHLSRSRGAVLLALAAAAAGMLLLTTSRWGLGVSYDSVVYVQASHRLSSIALPQPRDHGGEALYWWGPVYPLVLKAFGGTYSGARFLSALLLLFGVLLAGAIVWRKLGPSAGLTAAALYAFSPAIFSAHLDLLAEPLYLVLAVVALALIADRRSTIAGVVTGAAVLTRYAGLPLIVAGAITLRGRERLKFLGTSLAVYAVWLIRNEFAAGETTGRVLRWHPPSWSATTAGLRAFAHLFLTSGQLPSAPFGSAGLLAQLMAGAVLLFAVARADRERPPRIVTIGLLYAGAHCAFLATTVTLFDAATPLNERLLVPIAPPVIFALAWFLRAMPVSAALLVGVFAVASLQHARTASLYGIDYSGDTWSAARIDRASLPPVTLYSNWPAAVAYFTGRSPRRLPSPIDPHTLAANLNYHRELSQLAAAVRHGNAALVVLNDDFLQIPRAGIPLTAAPTFRRECRPLTNIVDLCESKSVRR